MSSSPSKKPSPEAQGKDESPTSDHHSLDDPEVLQTAEDFLQEPAIDPQVLQTAEDFLQGPAIDPQVLQTAEDFLQEPAIDPQVLQTAEDFLQGPAIDPQVLQTAEDFLQEPAIGSTARSVAVSYFKSFTTEGPVTAGSVGTHQGLGATPHAQSAVSRSSSTEALSLRALSSPTWSELSVYARKAVIGILLPLLLHLRTQRSQQRAHLERRHEHQEILANQREMSQRLDNIERHIEISDDEQHFTIVGRRSVVRARPDSQAVIRGPIRSDTQVEPITIDDGWVRIRYIADGEERHGWVAAKYLDTVDTEE